MTDPDFEDAEVFINDEDEAEKQQRQLNNSKRRRESHIHDESPWLDNFDQAYEDALTNIEPIE